MPFVEASSFDFTDAPLFRKKTTLLKSKVELVQTPREVVTTIKGKEETRQTAKIGDYIITGEVGEQYIIPAAKFPNLYVKDPSDPTRYISKNVVRAIELTEDTELLAPWGEKQRTPAGGVVVKSEVNGDVYLIEEGAFAVSYAIVIE